MNKLTCASIGIAALLLAPVANAEVAIPEGAKSQIGIMVGSAPDYYGSKDNEGVFGLYGRYQFEGTARYIQLKGPQLSANLLNDSNWLAGPMLKYRRARDNDVDNKIVSQMDEVDSTVEAGVFLGYRLPLSSERMHQVVFDGNVLGGKNGTEANLNVTYFQPISQTIVANIGLGMTYGNDEFMENYFGVTSNHDIALYPSLAGKAYNASSGIVSLSIPFGATMSLSEKWSLSAGARYERLQSDAKDSPVVDQEGDANQWIGGIGLAYVF